MIVEQKRTSKVESNLAGDNDGDDGDLFAQQSNMTERSDCAEDLYSAGKELAVVDLA